MMMSSTISPLHIHTALLFFAISFLIIIKTNTVRTITTTTQQQQQRWPNNQLNVLIDSNSLNASEQFILDNCFKQLEHKTCLKINRLAADKVSPFSPLRQDDSSANEQRGGGGNFLYIFKSQVGAYNRHPSLGFSSLGCVRQGRQSIVLTELAFKWPDLVLRYHLMRSLGIDNLERPDGQVRKLLNILPLSQKIESRNDPQLNSYHIEPVSYNLDPDNFGSVAESTGGGGKNNQMIDLLYNHQQWTPTGYNSIKASKLNVVASANKQQQLLHNPILSDDDLIKIKSLYECADYQNRLSVVPPRSALINADLMLNDSTTNATTNKPAAQYRKLDDNNPILSPLINNAAELIVDHLLKNDDQKQQQQQQQHQSHPTGSTNKPPTLEPTAKSPITNGATEPTNNLGILGQQCQAPDASCSSSANGLLHERPMLLKLDEFHAQDPQLKQANQMKLINNNNSNKDSPPASTYRLMDPVEPMSGENWPTQPQQQQQMQFQQQQQQMQQLQQLQQLQPPQQPKSEMIISFEQSIQQNGNNQIDSLVSSQVLKLCSCTCQTMKPSSPPATQPAQPPPSQPTPPIVYPTPSPVFPTYPPPTSRPGPPFSTLYPITDRPPPMTQTDFPPWTLPANNNNNQSTNNGGQASTSQSTETPPYQPPPVSPTTNQLPDFETITTTDSYDDDHQTSTRMTTTTPTTTLAPIEITVTQRHENNDSSTQKPPTTHSDLIANACDQVEWVRPNKTVYSSAKIVWDVDRGNQNYFLCNSLKDGELIPGKTHGFSCKVGQQGKAYELHQFNVLTKPESVNLAWVQRNSQSFGKTNFPVIGGYSKSGQDPYIVSRCLVKDENNDIITLIGYVNDQGVGWFPFDDIQIECAQYDVLACVS